MQSRFLVVMRAYLSERLSAWRRPAVLLKLPQPYRRLIFQLYGVSLAPLSNGDMLSEWDELIGDRAVVMDAEMGARRDRFPQCFV